MIEVMDICKSYGHFEAVKGLNFSVAKGDVLGLLGPNGAGKTTTMRLLTTFLAPTSGTARIGGFDILTDPHQVRRLLGYLPEVPPLYPEMRVGDYLRFCGLLRGISRNQIKGYVERVVERCALNSVYMKLCSHLSRGFRQRVGIAQALIHEPQIVILDEPTAGLDPNQIVSMRKLIAGLGADYTVIISTHILKEVEETCRSVLVISEGKVAVQGVLSEITQGKNLEQFYLEAVSATTI